MENRKLRKTASVLDRIFKFLQGVAIAGMIVPAIFIVLTAILGEKMIASSSRVTLGVLQLKLAGDASTYLNLTDIKGSLILMLVGGILCAAAIWYCLRVLREILVPMKEGSPFAEGISAKVRKRGWTVLIAGGVLEIARLIAAVFELKAYRFDRLLNMEAISSVTFNYTISLWFVGAALILFFLSYVFRYGEGLQKESDETL